MSLKTKHFLLWLAVVTITAAGLVWFLNGMNTASQPREISIETALQRIKNREIREARFRSRSVELIAVDGSRTTANVATDASRKVFFETILQFNKENVPARITFSEERN